MNIVINIVAFAILTILWLGFAAALMVNPAILGNIWETFRGLPLVIQVVVGLLVLPVAAALWIWETNWPLWVRLLLVIGLGVATLYMFFPRRA